MITPEIRPIRAPITLFSRFSGSNSGKCGINSVRVVYFYVVEPPVVISRVMEAKRNRDRDSGRGHTLEPK